MYLTTMLSYAFDLGKFKVLERLLLFIGYIMVYFKSNKHILQLYAVVIIFLCTTVVNYYCILKTHSFA